MAEGERKPRSELARLRETKSRNAYIRLRSLKKSRSEPARLRPLKKENKNENLFYEGL